MRSLPSFRVDESEVVLKDEVVLGRVSNGEVWGDRRIMLGDDDGDNEEGNVDEEDDDSGLVDPSSLLLFPKRVNEPSRDIWVNLPETVPSE